MYVFHIYLASCITAIQHSQSMRKTDKQGEVRKRRNSSSLSTGLGTPLGLHGVTQIAADTAQHTRTRKSVQAEIRTRHFWSPCWCVKAQVLAGGCQGPLWAGPLCSPCSQQAWASSWREQRPLQDPWRAQAAAAYPQGLKPVEGRTPKQGRDGDVGIAETGSYGLTTALSLWHWSYKTKKGLETSIRAERKELSCSLVFRLV